MMRSLIPRPAIRTARASSFGADYIMTLPEEFAAGVQDCLDERGNFQYELWSEKGMPNVTPLWLLKYLPNMPACHVAIYNDFRGLNNSITVREASANLAFARGLFDDPPRAGRCDAGRGDRQPGPSAANRAHGAAGANGHGRRRSDHGLPPV